MWGGEDQTTTQGLTADNVLYIAQQTADEDGCIDFDYVLKNRAEGGTWLAVPMGRTDISSAEAALDDLEYSGEEQFVSPVVTLNGETLTEGIDYYIEGDYSAMLPGTYSLTIRGMGIYAGQLTVGYKVTGEVPDEVTTDDETDVVPTDSEEEQPAETPPEEVPDETEKTVLIGDVNGDGIVNVTDISKAAAHVKGIKALSEEEFARADVDKDDAVKVTDISKIAAHIKGIRSLT